MRVSLAAAACVVLVALLAGCSTSSQGTSAMPSSVSTSGGGGASDFLRGGNHQGINPFAGVHGKLTLDKLFKLQLEGKLHRVARRNVLEAEIKILQQHGARPQLRFNPNHTPAMWATNSNYSYLIGLNKAGTKALTAVNTASTGCNYPYTVKVDHNGNAWTSCADNYNYNGGAAAEFSNTGVPLGTYSWTFCTPSSSSCYGYGYDVAANLTNVFAAVEYYFEEHCTPYCVYSYGDGYWWWPVGNPSAPGTFVNLYGYGMYDVYNMEVDASGNLWVDGYGCGGSWCGTAVGEVTSPASPSASFSWVISAPTLTSLGMYCPAGMTVNLNNQLAIVDNCSRKLVEFSLPSGAYAGTLGPTKTNLIGVGSPFSGAFNHNDTKVVIGDFDGWIDLGAVSTNKWNLKANPNLGSYVPGAAYDPSDK